MTPAAPRPHASIDALRTLALRYPEAEEGVACKGTALECPTVTVRGKAFLFLGDGEVRLKLRDAAAEAGEWASRMPALCSVGAHGWVLVKVGAGEGVPRDVLERWIDESYVLFAPKALAASRPAAGRGVGDASAAPKQTPARRGRRGRA